MALHASRSGALSLHYPQLHPGLALATTQLQVAARLGSRLQAAPLTSGVKLKVGGPEKYLPRLKSGRMLNLTLSFDLSTLFSRQCKGLRIIPHRTTFKQSRGAHEGEREVRGDRGWVQAGELHLHMYWVH